VWTAPFFMDKPPRVDHQVAKGHERSSQTIFFTHCVDGRLLLQGISAYTCYHIVCLAEIPADRNIVSSTCQGATTLFCFHGVRSHEMLLIKKAKS
jgi:hypothetical protein